MNKNVFINRTLNLRKIKYIGLDMDHTLVRYNTQAFEALAYEGMLNKLVSDKNYPVEVKELEMDFQSVVRGLVVDSARGNLLKVSRHGAIRGSRHGTMDISFHQQQRDYHGTYVDLSSPDFSSIDTAFSISVAILYGQLIDLKDRRPLDYPEYSKLLSDIVEVMDMSHRDDSLKSVVRDEMDKYIIQEPAVAEGLEKYKRHGKKLFILTNSDFHYSKALLDHA
ncbi:MAG: 5'-nucleotidase domain-containing protein, partial [Pseudomonadota bacterium]